MLVVYFSNWGILRTTNFATTSLQKSNPHSFLDHGKNCISPDRKEFHQLQLIKKEGHIQLFINGEKCIDFPDPGNDRWGPIYNSGKIGFRQMAETVAAYRNFRVWSLD